MKEPGILYRPSPWQARFHKTTEWGIHEVLGAGSAGPGKTTCLIHDIIDQLTVEHERCQNPKHPHHIAWGTSKGWALHLRRTRLNLEQTISICKRVFKQLDPNVEWNEARSTFTFASGFKYQFGHCKDPNDWENYLSFELSALYFDELTAFLEEQYDQICTRVRSSDPVLSRMLKIRSMSNPLMRHEGGEQVVMRGNPNWVRDRFVKRNPAGNEVFKKKLVRGDGTVEWHKWLYMPAKLRDNPDAAFVRQYELNLLNSPTHIRKALLDGDWFVTAGSFFAEYWDEKLHICEPFKCPKDGRFFRSMDWGYKNFGCIHWYFMDDDETLFVIKEMKFKGKLAGEVAAMVKEVEKNLHLWDERRNESLIEGVADTQLWEMRGQHSENMGEVFRRKGVGWHRADKKSRQANAQHIIKRLSDHDERTKTPGLVFFKNCGYILETLPAIQTSVTNSEEPADGGDDHGYDSLAYGVAYASRGRVGIPAKREPKEPWEEDDENVHTGRRGRHGYGQELC